MLEDTVSLPCPEVKQLSKSNRQMEDMYTHSSIFLEYITVSHLSI